MQTFRFYIEVAFLSALQNILMQITLLFASPVVVSMYALLAIPGSLVADFICRGDVPSNYISFSYFKIKSEM